MSATITRSSNPAIREVSRGLAAARDELDREVRGRERPQPPYRLVELPRRSDRVRARGLVPGDGHVDEALVEVPLVGRRGAPGELELLVGLEEASGADQRQAGLEPISGHAVDAT